MADLFSTGEPPLSRPDAAYARVCRRHTALLAQSRHAMTRQHAERDARMHARMVSDAALRTALYREIVEAALAPTRAQWSALCEQIARLDEQGGVTAARALRQIAQQVQVAINVEGAPVREHLESITDDTD